MEQAFALIPPRDLVPGAGSPKMRLLLHGIPSAGAVIHAGSQALYIRFGDRVVVGIVSRHAVHVPCALATALPALPEVPLGTPAWKGRGRLTVAGLNVGVNRLVSTEAPHLPDPTFGARLLAERLPDLTAVRRQLQPEYLHTLAAGDPGAVRPLMGRGDGLTPVGDDVLAGWLVMTRASGGSVAAIRSAVFALASRTTFLSAMMLADAADGASIPPFRDLALALARGRHVEAAIARLMAVGHTSGAGMLLGAHLALSRAGTALKRTATDARERHA